jgi:CRISPR-associated endonuclease Csy4
MDHYIDIKLLPDPEFSAPLLMGALYSKLHRALALQKFNTIGISFPHYKLKPKSLGAVLRIHGSLDALTQLQATAWLKGMRDHTSLTAIQPVPADTRHQLVKRRQYKTNAERLRRRRMKRKGETHDQALQAIPDSVERKPELPFLTLRSASTEQTFCLFVDQGEPLDQSKAGEFSCYGLSQTATVPYF